MISKSLQMYIGISVLHSDIGRIIGKAQVIKEDFLK